MIQQNTTVQSNFACFKYGIEDGDFVTRGGFLTHQYEFVSRAKQSQLQVNAINEEFV